MVSSIILYKPRRQNGVYDIDKDGVTPIHVKMDYFTKLPNGDPVNFNQDCYQPFVRSFIKAIQAARSDYLIFFEPIPGHDPPQWTEEDKLTKNVVYSPHWYDLNAIFSKVSFYLNFMIHRLLMES